MELGASEMRQQTPNRGVCGRPESMQLARKADSHFEHRHRLNLDPITHLRFLLPARAPVPPHQALRPQ
jgi:hypothetical protein